MSSCTAAWTLEKLHYNLHSLFNCLQRNSLLPRSQEIKKAKSNTTSTETIVPSYVSALSSLSCQLSSDHTGQIYADWSSHLQGMAVNKPAMHSKKPNLNRQRYLTHVTVKFPASENWEWLLDFLSTSWIPTAACLPVAISSPIPHVRLSLTPTYKHLHHSVLVRHLFWAASLSSSFFALMVRWHVPLTMSMTHVLLFIFTLLMIPSSCLQIPPLSAPQVSKLSISIQFEKLHSCWLANVFVWT